MFILAIIAIIPIILCPVLADKRGRSIGGWIVGGVFLGWIAVIILYLLPDLSYNYVPSKYKEANKSILNISAPSTPTIVRVGQYQCANCGEIIDTVQCPWCGKRKEDAK